MFSFQYPSPETNFPYYHCEDPDEFLDRNCEPIYYEDDDEYNTQNNKSIIIPDDVDDDDSVASLTCLDNQFRYTTIETDKEFLSKHLTKDNIIRRHKAIVKAQESLQNETEESPIEETPAIDIRPTNPWSNKDSQQTPTFSEIIEQQKTEEDDERKRLTLLSYQPNRKSHASRYETMSDHSSVSHASSPPVSTEKSRLCIYGKDCKNKKKCMRSHTFDEWQPNICRFNKRCRNNKCLYYHEGDDKTSYLSNIINSTKEQMAFYSKNKTMYIKNYHLSN